MLKNEISVVFGGPETVGNVPLDIRAPFSYCQTISAISDRSKLLLKGSPLWAPKVWVGSGARGTRGEGVVDPKECWAGGSTSFVASSSSGGCCFQARASASRAEISGASKGTHGKEGTPWARRKARFQDGNL